MLLTELWQKPLSGYYEPQDDNSALHLKDLRKSRLTLRQISKLRRMTDIKKLERHNKLASLRRQYVYIPPKGL